MGNVTTGKPVGGGLYYGAVNATAPSDMTKAMSTYTAFTALGLVSEDGVKFNVSRETETIKDWAGGVALVTQTGKTDTVTFTLISATKEEVQKLVYGDANVTSTASGDNTAITVKSTSDELEARSFVIDEQLVDGALQRIYIPEARVTEIGEISHTNGDAIGYEITITATEDEDGQTFTKWMLV